MGKEKGLGTTYCTTTAYCTGGMGGKKPPRHSFPPNAIEDESPATRRAKNETQAGKSTNLHPSKKVKRPILDNKVQFFVRADAPSN